MLLCPSGAYLGNNPKKSEWVRTSHRWRGFCDRPLFYWWPDEEPCRIYIRSFTLWSWDWTFTLWLLVNIDSQYHRDITTPLLLHHTPQPILSGYTCRWSKSFLQRCSKAGGHRAVPQNGLTQMYWNCGLRECEQQINNCSVFRKNGLRYKEVV